MYIYTSHLIKILCVRCSNAVKKPHQCITSLVYVIIQASFGIKMSFAAWFASINSRECGFLMPNWDLISGRIIASAEVQPY